MANKRIFTEEETNIMINLYNIGETYDSIAKRIKTKPEKVSLHLKNLGYGIRKKNLLKNSSFLSNTRKNFFNEHYFSEINNESKAYWLGFIYADGCVTKRLNKDGIEKGGNLEISLKSDDEYHLWNFLFDIESNIIPKRRTIKLNDKTYEASRINLNSIKLVNDLILHGCTPKKSLTLTPPDIDCNLRHHFIRGYFDGDGCVCFYPESYSYGYSILGTKEFLEYIVKESKVTSYKIISFEHKKCYELRIFSKKCAEIFHNYLYNGKSIFLERKYQKSLSMMRWCGLNDERNETQKIADLLNNQLLLDDTLLDCLCCDLRSETAALADILD